MDTRVQGPEISIVEGDICDREVDAIVNAANSHLWMGGGVAGAIKRRGGEEIEREAIAQGPIEVGTSVATKGGALPAGHVIHAAVMGADLKTSAGKIGRATLSALRLAADMGLTSMAFPALGTGVGGFPLEECARIMREALSQHLSEGTTLRSVEFVLFGRDAYAAFDRVFHADRA